MQLGNRVLNVTKRRDLYYWRLLATGLSFTLFGVGGLILGLVIFPSIALITRTEEKRVRRCRLLIHYSFRAFIQLMKGLGILTYSIEGAEHLSGRGKLVVANHPTLIDIVFLISLTPNASCIVKSDVLKNVFTRGPVSWAGYVANDAPEELLDTCIEQLAAGANLVVFPEGTRSVEGKALRFKRGAAYIWLRSNCKLVLATLNSDPPTLAKSTKWYRIPERRFHYSMVLRAADDLTNQSPIPLSPDMDVRRVNRTWQDYFQQEKMT